MVSRLPSLGVILVCALASPAHAGEGDRAPGRIDLGERILVPRCNATSQTARYKVVHNGITETKTVNQNATYDAWVSLGSFAFAGTGGEYVELADATGESYATRRLLGVDAVKWIRQ